MFEIEKNVPLPPPRMSHEKSKMRLALEALEVGDAVNCGDLKQASVGYALTNLKKTKGFKFATRRIDGVLRIYRIE
jgi:hypothetical protein